MSMNSSRTLWNNYSGGYRAFIVIAITVLLVYGNSLFHSFVGDDFFVVVNNNFVKSWNNLPLLFSKSYLTSESNLPYLGKLFIGAGELTYRPVVTLTYFIDYSIWKLNPFGYHLTNLLLHAANVVLLCYLVFLLAKNRGIALLTALFFALHPVNAEVVNVISHREDLLAFLFSTLSFILFIKFNENVGSRKLWLFILSLMSFLVALFSKEVAASLPIVLVLYSYFFKKMRFNKAIFNPALFCYMAVLFIYLFISFYLIGNTGELKTAYPGGSFYTNILTMLCIVIRYLQWLFFPFNIHATVPIDPSLVVRTVAEPRVLFSIFILLFFSLFFIKISKHFKTVTFSGLWFLVLLLPVSNMIPMRILMASRFLYLPSAAFCFLLAELFLKLPEVKPFFLPAVSRDIVIILVVFFSIFTFIRNLTWKNEITLWSELVHFYPKDPAAHFNLGQNLFMGGRFDKGIKEYKIASELDTKYEKDYFAILGNYYYRKGSLDEAEKEFKLAIEKDPNFPYPYDVLGIILGSKGLYKEAISCFDQVVKLDPKYIDAYYNLGSTYMRIQEWGKAREAFKALLKLSPEYGSAVENLFPCRYNTSRVK